MSWITFIFLPLLFVASIYGMNIDALEGNPSWYTALYFAVPLFTIVILSIHFIKHRTTIQQWLPYRKRIQSIVTSMSRLLRNQILQWRAKRRQARMGRWTEDEAAFMLESGTQEGADMELEDYRHRMEAHMVASIRRRELVLKSAVMSGCLQTVRFQLSHEPRLDLRTTLGASLCNHALLNGNYKIFKLLQQAGLDINIVDDDQTPPIFCAIRSGRLSVVKELIQMGAKLKARDILGRTALMIACKYEQDKLVKYLLSSTSLGRDWDYITAKESRLGKEAIHYAAQGGVINCVRHLLEAYRRFASATNGTPIDRLTQLDKRKRTPAMLAVTSVATIQFIQSQISKDDASDSKGILTEYLPLLLALSKTVKWARKLIKIHTTSTGDRFTNGGNDKSKLPAIENDLIQRTRVVEFYMAPKPEHSTSCYD
ncbi:ankyrin [Ascobolus immersus RN42]|uniref:Ankyrin n=1 Tax=Ascobolus immersus RN42 TaxID=1160509 RepID=A0A3N4HSI4_ASCIM|nr:ankyrin [Ascobolus immersus RN42]